MLKLLFHLLILFFPTDNENMVIQKRLTTKDSKYRQLITGCSSDVNKTAIGPKVSGLVQI